MDDKIEPEKLCIFCQHLEYEPGGTGAYAEPAMLYCGKNKEYLSHCNRMVGYLSSIHDIDDFREMIKTANDCEFYNPPSANKPISEVK